MQKKSSGIFSSHYSVCVLALFNCMIFIALFLSIEELCFPTLLLCDSFLLTIFVLLCFVSYLICI